MKSSASRTAIPSKETFTAVWQAADEQPAVGRTAIWRLVIAAALMLLSAAPVFSAPAGQPDLPCRCGLERHHRHREPAQCTAPDAASDDPTQTALAFQENADPLGLKVIADDLD